MFDTASFDPGKTDPLEAVMAQGATHADQAEQNSAAGGSQEPAGDSPAADAGSSDTPVPATGFKVGAPIDETGDGKSPQASKEASGEPESVKKDGEGDENTTPEYQPFSLPDGVKMDDKLMTAFTAKAGEFKLTQEQAQAFVDMQNQASLAARESEQASVAAFIRQQQEQFDKELESDPEVGGVFRERTLKRGNQALRTFDRGGRLGALAAEWGISNQPDWVKFLEAVGATLEEDVAPRGKGGGAEQTTAQMLFPDLK